MTTPIATDSLRKSPVMKAASPLATAALYGLLAGFCPVLAKAEGWHSLVWFPTGIGIAAMLRQRGGFRNLFAIALYAASFAATLALGGNWTLASQISLWNLLEIGLATALIRWVTGWHGRTEAPLEKLLPALAAALFGAAPATAALNGWSMHLASGLDWWSTTLYCYLLDGAGLALLLVPCLVLPDRLPSSIPGRKIVGGILLEVALLAAASLVLLNRTTKPFIFIAILISIVALRKGLVHTAILIWSAMLAILVGVWSGVVPSSAAGSNGSMLGLWVAATGTAFLPMLIGLMVDKNKRELRLLESNESKLRSLLDSASVGLALLDSNRRILRSNPFLVRISGMSDTALLERRIEEIASLPDGTSVPELDADAPGTRLRFATDTSESVRWGFARITRIAGDEGLLLLEVDDVTDAIEAEAELERSNSKLQTVVDNIPGLVGLWDREARNRFANRSFESWFGTPPDEIVGRRLREFIGDEGFEEFKPRVDAVLDGARQTFETDLPSLDGPRNALVDLIPYIEDRTTTGFFSLVTDITPIKTAQKAQLDSLARLGDIINGASEFSIIATSLDGTIQLFSQGAERMLGWSAVEMVGLRTPEAIHLQSELEARSAAILRATGREVEGFGTLIDAARHGEIETSEWTYLRKDGSTLPVQIVITALHNHRGEIDGYIGVARDVSKEREALRAIEDAREQAEQTSLMKSEFVANMSHEIRTPMNAVLGMVQLLGKTAVTPNQRKYLDMIRKSGKSLLGIIDDILDFSKIEAGRMRIEPMDFLLDDLLENIANIASMNAAGKDLEVSITVDPGVPTQLHGDSLRIQQVLVNLLGNALKFTMRGEVAMVVEVLSSDDQALRIGFRIRDTGIGMTDEQQRRLFQPFSQVDSSNTRRFGGTGLGLTISKKLLEMMNGQIGVRSMSQIGTEFFLSIPFPSNRMSETDLPALSIHPLNILAVEEHPSSQASLEAAAARWGWKLEFATNIQECLDLLGRREPVEPFDAVIVDGTTPGWDDRGSIGEIRETCQREITVIKTVRTAVENPADEGIRLLDGILVKPIVPLALLKILKNNLGHHSHEEEESRLQLERLNEERRTLQGVRVLLVEDNAFNQVVATETLQALGAGVDLAENGKAAVERLRRAPESFDIVLMDVQMPVMDGYTATRAIRQDLQLTLPVVAMTAGVLPSDRDKCKEDGMDDFISKPFEVDDLVRVIRRILSISDDGRHRESAKKPARRTVFQPDHLLQNLGGDDDALRTVRHLVKQYLSTVPNSIRTGKECAGRGDLEDATRAFHNLKSSSATLGALVVSSIAQKIEAGLQESERRNLGPLFEQLSNEFEKVVAEAKRWLNMHGGRSMDDSGTSFPSGPGSATGPGEA